MEVDPVEILTEALVREYLKRKGMDEVMECFLSEKVRLFVV